MARRWAWRIGLGLFLVVLLAFGIRRLLQEIDLLARTYGWTEGEILGMTDHRRRLYVGMALS